uniref:Uncharacterized protein n=1 Tax=Anguilla anguilla TaxID=7936 RepID=A0A0E9U5I7_ANGAN
MSKFICKKEIKGGQWRQGQKGISVILVSCLQCFFFVFLADTAEK